MLHLTVTAKKLNKRSLVPFNLPYKSNIAGMVLEGHSFEAVEAAVTEVPNQALGKWYKDRDGYFYWGGGVRVSSPDLAKGLPTVSDISFPPSKIDWKENFLGLTNELKTFTGKNVKIAIIDSGVHINHPDLILNIESPLDLTQNAISMSDSLGHGTAIAGIISANKNNINGIKGIASDCRIIPIKVIRNAGDRPQLETNILKAIQHSIDMKVDIINISLDLTDIVTQPVRELINSAAVKGIIMIGSAGDLDELTELGVTFPGSDSNFISIGASNKDFTKSIIDRKPLHLNFLGGLKDFWTLSNTSEKYRTVRGSSFCAAFISGACALLIERNKTVNLAHPLSRNNIIDELVKLSSSEQNLYNSDSFSFIKI